MNVLSSKLVGGNSVGEQVMVVPRTIEGERIPLVRQYLRIAARRRNVILGAIATCLALSLLVTLLMTPKYTAAAMIEISRESAQVTEFQGVEREANVADQEFYQTQYGLLRSRTLSERVATQLRLVDDPKFYETFGFSSQDPAFNLSGGRYPASGRPTRLRVAGEILLAHLDINPGRLSRLVNVRFTSPDPGLSARVANSWAENFIQTNLERKVQATSYARDLLERQLASYKDRLDASQKQLVAYASAQGIINLPSQTAANGNTTNERSLVADQLADLNSELSKATADRIDAEALFRRTASGVSTAALSNQAINGLRQKRAELAAQYEQLLTRFEPRYPAAQAIKSEIDDLDRSIAREDARVAGALRSGYSAAVDRENRLQARVDQLKAGYLDLRRRSIQYNMYQQEVDTNRALYDALLQRYKEVGVAGGVGVNNVSVVDAADVPQTPSSPRLMINLLVALLAGFLLGGALAAGLEQVDEAIGDPQEVERKLGLPLLGTVPKVEGETPEHALLDRKSDLFDAYLAVQTNLSFTTEHGVPRSFAVTSTRPAEGKSTTALALATTLARSQKKVILVDGDMRSPSVHHLGGVTHDRGLSNFLAGDNDIGSLVFEMRDLGFTAMSAGPIPPNAAELLTGSRLAVLIDQLLKTFDHVVVDSPPVMGLADAPLIAARVEGVIYAIQAHGIRSSVVKSALGRMASTNANIIGAVLTKLEPRKAQYGYGYEYGYGYGRDRAEEAAAAQ